MPCSYVEKKFREIVSLLHKGEYQIPRFQRDFVWKKEQVAGFIDSILRGFPTGSFVLWKTKEKLQACREIESCALIEPDPNESVHYILDGQQRMTALFLVYQGLQVRKSAKIVENYQDILLGIEPNENGEYCFAKNPKEEITAQVVRVYDLFNQSILDIQETYQLSIEAARQFDKFKQKIEDYRFPIIEITDTPLEEIIEIFSRINTGGTKLSSFEVLCAKFYMPPEADSTQTFIVEKGFDLEEKFQNLNEELEHLDYGFDKKQSVVILQLLSYLVRYKASGNLTEKISIPTLLKLDPKVVQKQWDFVAPCFKNAAQFLKHDLKIPSFDFLPSVGSLMLIAYFFALSEHKSPNANQIANLRRLFFRGAFFSSKIVGDTLLKQLGLVEHIYQENRINFKEELPFYAITKEFLTEEKLNVKSGLQRGVLCVLATLEPKNFDNNSKVVLDNLFIQIRQKRNLHHFFPKNHLKHIGFKDNTDVIANMTLIDARLNQAIKDTPPKQYIQKYQQNNPHLEQTLATHLIDLNDLHVLENYDAFLQMRAQKILEAIKKLTWSKG